MFCQINCDIILIHIILAYIHILIDDLYFHINTLPLHKILNFDSQKNQFVSSL